MARLFGCVMLAAAAWAPGWDGALAQQGGAGPSDEEAAESAPILIVSMDRILKDSGAAQAIQARADELRGRLRTEFQSRESALRDEELELARLRDTMNADAFSARAAEFKEKVRVLRRETNETGARLQRAVLNATGDLKLALQPILLQLMSERRALVMLDEKDVVISAKALDVTQEAIERLDASSPQIELRLPPAPDR